jgi:hypothetical protein
MIGLLSPLKGAYLCGIPGKKFWMASLIAAQIVALIILLISFPFPVRHASLEHSTAPRTSHGATNTNSRNVQPTLLVGVFITNATSSTRLTAFRRAFETARTLVQFNLHHVFVLGNTQFANENFSDFLRLPIHENMDEGKTFQYFVAAINWFSNQNVPYHPLSGIVKMDTDTAVDWLAFSNGVLPRLEPMYYLGRRNSRKICGNLLHCPPSDCLDFSNGCWVYMSGGWYALSFDLAKRSILNCSYAASHSMGYEDLTVGTWISHCSSAARVFHVDNGEFFCHSSFILDRHIYEMQFPKQNWFFFDRVNCLNANGKVK